MCRRFLSTNGEYVSCDSSVGILTRPWSPRPINYGSIPGMVDRLSLSSMSRPAIRPRKQPVQRIPGIKGPQGKGGLLLVPRLRIRGDIHTLRPRGLRRRSAAARLLRSWVRIPQGAWIVCCERCVLSDRGPYDELITRPEESYRLCCVGCVI